MMYIVLVSAAVFVINLMDTTGTLLTLLAFHPGLIMRGQIWRLVTWVFLPLNNNILFTAIMLYFYFFIGGTLENEWGTAKFTIFYIFGVVLNIVYGFALWFIYESILGRDLLNLFWLRLVWQVPHYINLSMFFAFAALFPEQVIRLFFIIPVKIKWVALVNAGYFVFSMIMELINGQVAAAILPVIALFNFFVFCGQDLLDFLRPLKAQSSPQAINFKKAARKARQEYDDKHYRHKCAVCGKTDTDYPDLEFRYCSRCNGYHCFCEEHINNHIHFQ